MNKIIVDVSAKQVKDLYAIIDDLVDNATTTYEGVTYRLDMSAWWEFIGKNKLEEKNIDYDFTYPTSLMSDWWKWYGKFMNSFKQFV